MSKMGLHDPFEYLKHKLWPKEATWVKLPIWLPTTKSQKLPRFPCMQMACHIILERYNFAIDLTSIRGLYTKLCASKIAGVLILRILGVPSGRPRTKWHLGASPMARHKIYYRREGDGFPQVQAVVSFVSLCLPVARSYTKGVRTMH
jgi:hypothetical protein